LDFFENVFQQNRAQIPRHQFKAKKDQKDNK